MQIDYLKTLVQNAQDVPELSKLQCVRDIKIIEENLIVLIGDMETQSVIVQFLLSDLIYEQTHAVHIKNIDFTPDRIDTFSHDTKQYVVLSSRREFRTYECKPAQVTMIA